MTSTPSPAITLTHPSELLASIPALLGFHPSESLVTLGLRGERATELTLVLRSDLPPPQQFRELAHCLLPPLVQHGAAAVAQVVIGGRPQDDDLPGRELLARCEAVFVAAGLPIVHQLWLPETSAGSRWRCYDETDCTGLLPDPDATSLATLAASSGLTVHDRREDIAATLTADPDDILARRSAALDRASADAERGSPYPPRQRWQLVRDAIEAAIHNPPDPSDEDVIQLAMALSDHRIRDMCLDFDELPDVLAAERLWTALARAMPPPEQAEPACLLAYSAYARGDGVLAGIALQRAETADPGHRLSSLLRGALTIGLSPDKLRTAGIRAATYARKAMANGEA